MCVRTCASFCFVLTCFGFFRQLEVSTSGFKKLIWFSFYRVHWSTKLITMVGFLFWKHPCFIVRNKSFTQVRKLSHLHSFFKQIKERRRSVTCWCTCSANVCRDSSSWSEIHQPLWYLYRHFPMHTIEIQLYDPQQFD